MVTITRQVGPLALAQIPPYSHDIRAALRQNRPGLPCFIIKGVTVNVWPRKCCQDCDSLSSYLALNSGKSRSLPVVNNLLFFELHSCYELVYNDK